MAHAMVADYIEPDAVLTEEGVDGLFTDFADKAVNYLKKQGLK